MTQILNFFKTIMIGFSGAWDWLTTEIELLGITPLAILSVGGIATIIGFKVFALVNPIG